MKRLRLAFALFVIMLFFSFQSESAQVLSINLQKTVGGADVAFSGVCKKVYSHKLDNGLLVTTYDFDVIDDLNGNLGDKFSFTQWGASIEDSKKYEAPYVYGMPTYKIGREYLVFLTAETKLGLRAPVGLGQGKFNIMRTADGKKTVKNDHNNRSIFSNLHMSKGISKTLSTANVSTTKPGPIDYKTFIDLVKDIEKGGGL